MTEHSYCTRRSEALAQRSADLDKLADAWQPLYKTLTPEQRQRMAALAIFVLHDMSDVLYELGRHEEAIPIGLVIIVA